MKKQQTKDTQTRCEKSLSSVCIELNLQIECAFLYLNNTKKNLTHKH